MGDGQLIGRDLAIDLGTANTLVYRPQQGIVFNEPAVVALNGNTGELVALGEEAWEQIGGPGNVVALRPLRSGTLTEFEITERMLEVVLRRVGAKTLLSRPRLLICVSSMSSTVERRALEEAAKFAGAREVILVEEPLAAAIGARLPVAQPKGSLIVDIGGGRSEMAVVSMGGVVSGQGVNTGGFDLDAAIQSHLKATYNMAIGDKTAEEIKIAIGSAFPSEEQRVAVVTGRDLSSGNRMDVRVNSDEIRKAMSEPIAEIVRAARRTLAEAPPELTHDVLERGMFLTGGGSLLRGLNHLLSQECEVPVHVSERPMEAVALGAGQMLENLESYRASFRLVRDNRPGTKETLPGAVSRGLRNQSRL